jgi:predicted DNA-binding transcriptional regulator YafY
MKFEIMLGILFDLLSKRCVTAKYLASKYEVSLRSIYRYVNSLELAGVPIYTNRGKGGGFTLVDTYKLSSTFMTVDEFERAINAMSAIADGITDKVLESAINKLKASVKNEYNSFNVSGGSLIIDGGTWGDSLGYKSKLLIIQKSIESSTQLLIKYHDRNGEITERVIEPHVIVFKQGLWYVFAYCNLRKEFRLFKTGRIHSATLLKTKFIKQNVEKLDIPLDYWNTVKEGEDVVLKIDKSVISDVEEWLGIETIESVNGEFFANAKLPVDNGLISKILGYGDGVKVLGPVHLKEKVLSKALAVVNLYKK